ncbi:hypothetical protein BKA70DRAFT_688362 [Coprinopsis sp. MPI-PUGE-AT-0042]|nr:hypothetical protein BKA70DRAFT_688362 [Coprinopsis sp. MPI-PUGE-AT-0042]
MSRLPKRLFALTIGIDKYLKRIRSLRNEKATRSTILHELTDLITNPYIEENDPILIYFAGHGNLACTPVEWTDWDHWAQAPEDIGFRDQESQWIQCLAPHDSRQPDGKGGIIHGIPDRTLGTIMHRIANAKGNNITVILDCCYTGSCSLPEHTSIRSAWSIAEPMPADLDEELFSGKGFSPKGSAPILPKFRHHGIESHVVLAACKPEEMAFESYGKGAFTSELLRALNSLDIGSITYSELIRHMRPLARQNPQCEGKVDRLLFSNKLRCTDPRDQPSVSTIVATLPQLSPASLPTKFSNILYADNRGDLAAIIQDLNSVLPLAPQPTADDGAYKNCTFWKGEAELKALNQKRASDGLSALDEWSFLTNIDGQAVSKDRRSAMREFISELFDYLYWVRQTPQKKWMGEKDHIVMSFVKAQAYRNFPELGYAIEDCKLIVLMSDVLTQWERNEHSFAQNDRQGICKVQYQPHWSPFCKVFRVWRDPGRRRGLWELSL